MVCILQQITDSRIEPVILALSAAANKFMVLVPDIRNEVEKIETSTTVVDSRGQQVILKRSEIQIYFDQSPKCNFKWPIFLLILSNLLIFIQKICHLYFLQRNKLILKEPSFSFFL